MGLGVAVFLFGMAVRAAVPPMSAVNATNAGGATIVVKLPGYFAVELASDGEALTGRGKFPGDYDGLDGFWDLKNDPEMKHNLASQNTGLMEYQWRLLNKDGSERTYEGKAAPGVVSILESNNVRTRLKYSYRNYAFGNAANPADCCVTINEYFSIYRPDKIFQTIKFSYSGADGMGPVRVTSWQFIPKVSWMHVSNEPAGWGEKGPFEGELHTQASCGFVPRTPSPWLYLYQDPETDYRKKTYILYSVSGKSAFPRTVECSGAPTPGDISVCANYGCVSAGISGHVAVKSNFLAVIGEGSGEYIANPFQYFIGARARIMQESAGELTAGSDVFVRHAALFAGDNGITDKASAEAYAAEYRKAPTLAMASGQSQGFNQEMGDYELTADAAGVDFAASGTLHQPAFDIAGWTAATPATIQLAGLALTPNEDYVAVVDNGRLLVQVLKTVQSGARIQILSGSAPVDPPKAKRRSRKPRF